MKRNIKKPLCITLCTLLLAGSIGIAAHAAVPNEKNFGTAAASNGTAGLNSLNSDMLAAAAPSASTGSPLSGAYEQNSKTETVYVFASASGEVHKIIVSDWIHNPLGSDTLTDSSTLGSVENVKGDETYTVNEAGLRVWDAKGYDIYCHGTTDSELPVSVSVSFSLDGVPVSAEELAGKSGRVKIRFDYITKCSETVEIDGKEILKGLSLNIDKNEIHALMGENGAGKSTLMNIITGNLKPSSGTVLCNEENVHDMGAVYRSLLGYAPQQQGLYDTFTGIRFLSYMATLKGIPKKKHRDEIQRVLNYVNLPANAYRPIGTYSGVKKQRILIAQAILGDPHLIVLDEPTAGLDPKERVRIRENILNISGGKIILVSTHVVSDIESIAKEIILLREGKIVGCDTVSSLCKKHGDVKNLEQVYLQVFEEEENNGNSHTI